jgi:hypothetical protein
LYPPRRASQAFFETRRKISPRQRYSLPQLFLLRYLQTAEKFGEKSSRGR